MALLSRLSLIKITLTPARARPHPSSSHQSSHHHNNNTMKILSIQIYKPNPSDKTSSPIILTQSSQLSHFGYFQQGKVQEVINFAGRLLAERAEVGKNSYEKGEYYNYVNKRSNGLSFILITDKEYPPRVAFTLLHKLAMDFENEFPKDEWQKEKYNNDNSLQWSHLKTFLDKYQDPQEADDLMKIKQDLAETKEVVHQALEKVMERGEKMENLVSRSNDLSYASKLLYNTSADENSCCILM